MGKGKDFEALIGAWPNLLYATDHKKRKYLLEHTIEVAETPITNEEQESINVSLYMHPSILPISFIFTRVGSCWIQQLDGEKKEKKKHN